VAEAVTQHTGAHSIDRSSVQFRQCAWYRSLLQYCYKHFSRGSQRRLRLACAVGLSARWAACWLGLGNRDERRAYAVALRQVVGSPVAGGSDTILGRTSIVES
jgi:hypothetical protein